MKPERPEAGEPRGDPTTSPELSGTASHETSSSGTRRWRTPLLAGVIIGVGVAAFLFFFHSASPQPSSAREPKRGVACPYLRAAFGQLKAGNKTAFVETVKVAAHQAEATLQRSGELFGRPERLALELRSLVTERSQFSKKRIETTVRAAESSCTELGR